MATPAEWQARQRAKLVAVADRGLLSPGELVCGLLDALTPGREAAELAADPPAVQAGVLAALAAFASEPLPPPFWFGPADPAAAARLAAERRGKRAAAESALGPLAPDAEPGAAVDPPKAAGH